MKINKIDAAICVVGMLCLIPAAVIACGSRYLGTHRDGPQTVCYDVPRCAENNSDDGCCGKLSTFKACSCYTFINPSQTLSNSVNFYDYGFPGWGNCPGEPPCSPPSGPSSE